MNYADEARASDFGGSGENAETAQLADGAEEANPAHSVAGSRSLQTIASPDYNPGKPDLSPAGNSHGTSQNH
jgi:hypothetical protein